MAHNRLEEGGWARDVTVRELLAAKSMAVFNMRLEEGVVRELHWHKEAEWAYILEGSVRLTVVDADYNAAKLAGALVESGFVCGHGMHRFHVG